MKRPKKHTGKSIQIYVTQEEWDFIVGSMRATETMSRYCKQRLIRGVEVISNVKYKGR